MKLTRRRQASHTRRRRENSAPAVAPAPEATGPLARGIEATRAWLTKHDTTPYRFALDYDIDPTAFAKLLRGKRKRISIDHGLKIQTGTMGAVPLAIWGVGE